MMWVKTCFFADINTLNTSRRSRKPSQQLLASRGNGNTATAAIAAATTTATAATTTNDMDTILHQ